MSETPSTAPSTHQQYGEELSLSHSMKAADSIRRHFNLFTTESSGTSSIFAPNIPPGIIQGVGACLVVGTAILPVRRLVLGHPSIASNESFRNFVDLIVSVGHALVATQAGLIAGSIYGGKTYLDEFIKQKSVRIDPSSSRFSLVENICQDLNRNIIPPGTKRPMGLDPNSYDPRVQTMLSMIRVLEICQESEKQ